MNNLDIIVESNWILLANATKDEYLNYRHRMAIIGRLTDAICKRSLVNKLGGIK